MSANTARKSSASGVAGWNRKGPSTVRADRRGRAGVFPITFVEVAPEDRANAQVRACGTLLAHQACIIAPHGFCNLQKIVGGRIDLDYQGCQRRAELQQ